MIKSEYYLTIRRPSCSLFLSRLKIGKRSSMSTQPTLWNQKPNQALALAGIYSKLKGIFNKTDGHGSPDK